MADAVAAAKAELDAAIQKYGKAVADAAIAAAQPEPTPAPSTIPDAQAGNVLTVKSSTGKTTTTTGTSRVVKGATVTFANGRTTVITGTDDGVTFTTREPSADYAPAAAALAGTSLKVNALPKPNAGSTGSAPVVETPVVTVPVVTAPVPGTAVLKNIPYLGLNLAAHSNANQVLPGEAGTHFKWPSRSDVRYYVGDLGIRLLRFPYALQRAIPIDSTGLPLKGGQLDQTFVAKAKALLGWIREDSNGEALVIFDPHHYWRIYRNQTAMVNGVRKQTGALLPAGEAANQGGRWLRQEQVLIDEANGWGAADLADHIAAMVTTFDEAMILGYGAGNEPYAAELSVSAMEAKVLADLNVMFPIIRKVTNKPIFVCGNQWASARNWANISGTFAAGIKDPANNWIPEVHGYGDLSGDSSGKYNSGNLNAIPVEQVAQVFRPAYAYMAAKGLRCFVGETGIPPTDAGRAALVRALDEAKANGVPVTLWIAGGDGAMSGEKMSLDDTGHAATRDLIKSRAGERMAEWKAPRSA